MIGSGIPWILTTSLKNKLATWLASWVHLHGKKWALFENLSTTTKIESIPFEFLVDQLWSPYRCLPKGQRIPMLWAAPFKFWHTWYLCTYLVTSFFNWDQKYLDFACTMVLSLPKCPLSSLLCTSWISLDLIGLLGMHNLWSMKRYPCCILNLFNLEPLEQSCHCSAKSTLDLYNSSSSSKSSIALWRMVSKELLLLNALATWFFFLLPCAV